MRPTKTMIVLSAFVVATATLVGSTYSMAKPQKSANGPGVVFNAIAKAARSTFGIEAKRKNPKRTRGPRARHRAVNAQTVAPLPATVPLPANAVRTDLSPEQAVTTDHTIPAPSPRPSTEAVDNTNKVGHGEKSELAEETAALVMPDTVPIPQPSPLAHGESAVPMSPQVPPDPVALPYGPINPPTKPERRFEADARSYKVALTTMPAEEMTCRARLRTLGVEFEDRPAESSEDGCALPYPISVSSLGDRVKLQPAALMDCAMAETMSGFTGSVIDPVMKENFGHGLRSIEQASAYVCRPRNGTMKLSEHAFGNALDIARFTLDDGTAVDVKPDPGDKAEKALAKLRQAACGPFKTVLGPGSNADHELHLHFDLAPRRNGATYCH